jgi:hypothetical protein
MMSPSRAARLSDDGIGRSLASNTTARQIDRRGPEVGRAIARLCFAAACAAVIAGGLHAREERYWTPEHGFGYALGVGGTACMLLLLLYSLRKRLAPLRSLGRLRHWLGVHMALGLLGPIAILLHANFRLGSLNSNVALACALTVSASGIVGRLIYPKIHHGLSGRRTSLRELREAVESMREALDASRRASPGGESSLRDLESLALERPVGLAASLRRFLIVGRRARIARRDAGRALRRAAASPADARRAARELDAYLGALRRVARFSAYERLFSLWHAFHLPLCFLLFGAAAVHVVAVHVY